jgi:tRNA 2-thiouridine synthesizing protein C
MRRLLFLMRRPPHGTRHAREALDAILAASAFEVPSSVLFDGDGVFLLLAGQDASGIGEKNLASSLEALPMFDVEDLYVHGPSLRSRGLGVEDLILPVREVDDAGTRKLIGAADRVLSF